MLIDIDKNEMVFRWTIKLNWLSDSTPVEYNIDGSFLEYVSHVYKEHFKPFSGLSEEGRIKLILAAHFSQDPWAIFEFTTIHQKEVFLQEHPSMTTPEYIKELYAVQKSLK